MARVDLGQPHAQLVHGRRTRAVRLRRPGAHRSFFLSGGQIDGQANINLVGIGDIACLSARRRAFPARSARPISTSWCWGDPVPPGHSPRVLVDRCGFHQRAGCQPAGGVSPGRAVRAGDDAVRVPVRCAAGRASRWRACIRGIRARRVREATGFDYDEPAVVPVTPTPDAERGLRQLRYRCRPHGRRDLSGVRRQVVRIRQDGLKRRCCRSCAGMVSCGPAPTPKRKKIQGPRENR